MGKAFQGIAKWVLVMELALSMTGCRTLTSIKEVNDATSVVLPSSLEPNGAASIYRKATLKTSNAEKLGHFLRAAELSVKTLDSEASNPSIYNASCAEVAQLAHEMIKKGEPLVGNIDDQHTFEVSLIDADSRNFLEQERVVPASRLRVKRLDQTAILDDGIGGTLIAYSRKDSELYQEDPNIPQEGRALALTSVVCFPAAGSARIEIHDPGLSRDITLEEQPFKLAGDFSTPFGYLGSRTAKGNIGLKAMVNAADNEWIRGLSHFEPFEPNQIPVVFIHGLQSAPRVWKNTYLEIIKDERIRENFQFWYYRYPTGYGIGHNALEFRNAFRKCVMRHDSTGTNESMNQTVLVGHSMGGLLSSISIRSSGSNVWDKIAEISPEELDVDEETRKRLTAIAFFEPIPQISRAVFLAAPHRGADMAGGAIGRLGNRMIKLPRNLVQAGVTLDMVHGLTSLGLDSLGTQMTSIDYLKPNAWQLETVLSLPISERVKMHSIIGKMRKNKPLENSSDGVVPYWSSHIEGVDSEIVVHSSHGSVPENPDAIRELSRILHLHLDELGR